ncbi:MAG: hypothetical protein ACQCN6_11950 [Candidatus Bathyarchaeia archaeon]
MLDEKRKSTLLIFFLGTWKVAVFWVLCLGGGAGWLWTNPQADARVPAKFFALTVYSIPYKQVRRVLLGSAASDDPFFFIRFFT